MKKVLFFIQLVFTCYSVNAQTWQWGKQGGHPNGDHWDEGYGITTDGAGNEFVTGNFMDTVFVIGNDTLHSFGHGTADIFFAKYDSNGNALWAKKAGGHADDIGTSTCTDRGGNVFFTGYFNSPLLIFGTDTLHNAGGQDAFIVKYDTNGNLLWVKDIGGASNEAGVDIATDAAGNLYAHGSFLSPALSFDTITLHYSAHNNAYIVKYDPNGNVIWAKNPCNAFTAGGNNIKPLSADAFGNTYFMGTGATNIPEIIRLNTAGNVLWTKNLTGVAPDGSVCADRFGNVYATGYFFGITATFDSVTLTNTSTSTFYRGDMFLVKYDSAGTFRWVRRTTGDSNEWGIDLDTDSKGNVFVSGSVYGGPVHFDSIAIASPDSTSASLFLAKYDSTGNVLSVDRAGVNNYYTIAWSVSVAPSDNVYITGSYGSDSIRFGPDVLLNPNANTLGATHFFIAKWEENDITTNIVTSEKNNSLTIYPNPFITSATVKINTELKGNSELRLYNVFGQEIKKITTISGQQIIINREDLKSGIYFISVFQGNKAVATGKLVITGN